MSDSVHVPSPQGDHPLIDDLVAFVDGELDEADAERISGHVAGCPECQHTLDDIGAPLTVDAADLDEIVGDRLFEALAPMPVTGEPRPGEVWQIDWEGEALVALVLDADGRGALVGVVTRDRPTSAPDTTQLPLAELDVALWVLSISLRVPLGVFRHPLALAAPDALDAVRSRFDEDDPDLSGDPMSTEWPDVVDRLQRADLAVAATTLAMASWVPSPAEEQLDLAALLRDRRKRPSDIAKATGVPAADLTALIRGARRATPAEADVLSAALDVPARALRAHVSLPDALVRAIEQPILRSAIEARAAQDGVTEADGRLGTAEAVHAMAARTTRGERDVDTWTELIQQHLDG